MQLSVMNVYIKQNEQLIIYNDKVVKHNDTIHYINTNYVDSNDMSRSVI